MLRMMFTVKIKSSYQQLKLRDGFGMYDDHSLEIQTPRDHGRIIGCAIDFPLPMSLAAMKVTRI